MGNKTSHPLPADNDATGLFLSLSLSLARSMIFSDLIALFFF
jgi:hypothetical protein